ncbi:hypothetical protein SAMN05443550_101128 [Pedobacter hartonius]|uniref:Uncharacterized protein n=1 Tax=Pedobacter hartonius TaxID=425514 RepID=A0A1H3W7B8_9SPHI|nr:hypothetical protein SAMN05443550_101128 [Pedobacter hartonius]
MIVFDMITKGNCCRDCGVFPKYDAIYGLGKFSANVSF